VTKSEVVFPTGRPLIPFGLSISSIELAGPLRFVPVLRETMSVGVIWFLSCPSHLVLQSLGSNDLVLFLTEQRLAKGSWRAL
jgi:hypothetical protein